STERVWFYDLMADGFSLDDKRTPLKGDNSNDLPDAIAKWKQYQKLSLSHSRAGGNSKINKAFGDKTQKAFVVDAADIRANKYDLSINRYKEVVYEEEQYESPKKILKRLKKLEMEILSDLDELERML